MWVQAFKQADWAGDILFHVNSLEYDDIKMAIAVCPEGAKMIDGDDAKHIVCTVKTDLMTVIKVLTGAIDEEKAFTKIECEEMPELVRFGKAFKFSPEKYKKFKETRKKKQKEAKKKEASSSIIPKTLSLGGMKLW